MVLNELVETIELIRSRIAEHREYLSGNEIRTRQVLIDPLLRELGWDVGDPSQVDLEFTNQAGRADYALLKEGRPVALVEAKRLGHRLELSDIMQVLNYANTAGVEYMVLTNGDRWEMYSVFTPGALEGRKVMDLMVSESPVHATALGSLTIWRRNVRSGSEPLNASHPAFEPPMVDTHGVAPEQVLTDTSSEDGVAGGRTGRNWHSIGDVSFLPSGRNVAELRIANQSIETSRWTNVPLEIATWLLETGHLSMERLPVKFTPNGSRYLIARNPSHANGREFANPKRLPYGLVMECNFSAKDALNVSRLILKRCRVPLDTVQFRLRN